MPDLLELSRQLQDTNATLAQVRRLLSGGQPSSSLLSSIASLEVRQHHLEELFLAQANSLGLELCAYRLFGEDEEPKAAAIGRALDTFQGLVSSVYGAIKAHSPRKRGKLSAETLAESTFNFGYAYAGSVGFVLTIPNDRMLLGDSTLDESITTVFALAKARSPDEISNYASRLGPSSIRSVYKWAKALSSAGLGADVEWRRDSEVRSGLLVQAPELILLQAAIEATSDLKTSSVELEGMLVGLQSEKRTFDMAFDQGTHIRGAISQSITFDEPLRIPSRYFATFTKSVWVRYSTDENEERWTLESLKPI